MRNKIISTAVFIALLAINPLYVSASSPITILNSGLSVKYTPIKGLSNKSVPSLNGVVSTSKVSKPGSHGELVAPPVLIASLSAAQLTAALNSSPVGQQLIAVTGQPTYGVDFYYIKYSTLDGKGQPTTASGALWMPKANGLRPIVLYAHGTAVQKNYNIANIVDPTNPAYAEATAVWAMFAAQGFVVVAPNYAGYDTSTLTYHPYHNANQQSGEMIDILHAARQAIPKLNSSVSDSHEVFITGYSQGGHVALATLRAMQKANENVTAAAPAAGVYPLAAFGDAIFLGNVALGSTVFGPLLTAGYQNAYGNLYSSTSDIYSDTYATGIDTLLPSAVPIEVIFANNLLPPSALFNINTPTVAEIDAIIGSPSPLVPCLGAGTLPLDYCLAAIMQVPSNPLFASGFGDPYLVKNSYRIGFVLDAFLNPDGAIAGTQCAAPAAVLPTQTLRQDFYINDLRNGSWAPQVPLMLIGGFRDPFVFFQNAQIMKQFWSCKTPVPQNVSIYSVDPVNPADPNPITTCNVTPSPCDGIQTAFLDTYNAFLGGFGQLAAIQAYHGTIEYPFAMLTARNFFLQVLATVRKK